MLILLVIIIGLASAITLDLPHFKFFFLSLFVWSYFPKKWSLFFPFFFRTFSWRRQFFLVIFDELVCWGFMQVMLVVTSTARATIIVFLLSLLLVLVYTFPIIFGVSAILRCLFFSQTLRSNAETRRSVVHVPFLFFIKDSDWFFLFFLAVSLP